MTDNSEIKDWRKDVGRRELLKSAGMVGVGGFSISSQDGSMLSSTSRFYRRYRSESRSSEVGEIGTKWNETYGGKFGDRFESVVEVGEGYLGVGHTSSSDNGSAGLVVKTDKNGKKQWKKWLGDSLDTFKSVIEVSDGYILAGANTSDTKDSLSDGWLVKTNKKGDPQWEKTVGGEYIDIFHSVVDVDDGYLTAGFRDSCR